MSFRFLIVLFVALPLVELMLLIKLGEVIGFSATVLLVIVTGIAGGAAARLQGTAVLNQIRLELAEGRIPGEAMIDGVLVFTAGILLVTPGVLTDLLGLCLLIPVTRRWFKQWLRKKFDDFIRSSRSGPGGPDAGFRVFIR